MPRKRYSEEQIIQILKETSADGPRSVRFCGGTGSRRKPTTAGGPNLAGWKSVTPGGCGNWKTRTGA